MLVATCGRIAGGEIHEYTRMLENARHQAVDRLVRNASMSEPDGIPECASSVAADISLRKADGNRRQKIRAHQ
jgi:uncharacterized protein YbjQ (UPF0145 family)